MTQNDIKLAVIAANDTLATNNPKGLTIALRKAGYYGDSRYDILGHDALTKMLMELYVDSPKSWGKVMQSVPFDYQSTDSSTNPETKSLFQNISKAIDPNSASAKLTLPKWFDDALGLIIGSTTTTHVGTTPADTNKTPIWAYVGLSVIGVVILIIVYMALKQKSI